uniref:50S ribosomal protein L3 n=2 Tax=Lygus hesperus TaxID=30085 RepID=A0A0A9WUE8_LYGHE
MLYSDRTALVSRYPPPSHVSTPLVQYSHAIVSLCIAVSFSMPHSAHFAVFSSPHSYFHCYSCCCSCCSYCCDSSAGFAGYFATAPGSRTTTLRCTVRTSVRSTSQSMSLSSTLLRRGTGCGYIAFHSPVSPPLLHRCRSHSHPASGSTPASVAPVAVFPTHLLANCCTQYRRLSNLRTSPTTTSLLLAVSTAPLYFGAETSTLHVRRSTGSLRPTTPPNSGLARTPPALAPLCTLAADCSQIFFFSHCCTTPCPLPFLFPILLPSSSVPPSPALSPLLLLLSYYSIR